MNTISDVPFAAGWCADDLADAVPRRLSTAFDPALVPGAPCAARVPPSPALMHRYMHCSALPPRFLIR